MSKKLLNKTTGDFLLYAVCILLVAAPLFYFIVEKLYLDETDETLVLHKKEFGQYYLGKFDASDIATWNKYNRNIKILPFNGMVKDTIVSRIYFDKLENENEPYRELWGPVTIHGTKFTYLEKTNLIEKEDMVFSIAGMFLLVIVLLLAGIALISKKSSARRWKPFYNTLRQIRDFEIDKSRQPQFPQTDIEEFDSLNKSISRLIEKNVAIYKNQREFIENAAHELQTPLALFRTKIDTLSQSDNMTEEDSAILESLQNDVARFNRLNKNLLLLSKIENDVAMEQQPVIINDYIIKNLEFFTEQADARNITIETIFDKTLTINSNPGLAEVMINNLFLNAIRHNHKKGKIVISITSDALQFCNTGIKEPLSPSKLFNRFVKSVPSSQGNGLGLAIIKKITETNQWEVTYAFAFNMHCFKVKF